MLKYDLTSALTVTSAVLAGAALLRALYLRFEYYTYPFQDVPFVGNPSKAIQSPQTRKNTRAIVIGGGWAGLCAARILLDHFDQVIVLESENMDAKKPWPNVGPDSPEFPYRKNTPHDRHAHALLSFSITVLEKLFPSFTDGLVAKGGYLFDLTEQILISQGEFMVATKGVKSTSSTRVMLEAHLRERLLKGYPEEEGRLLYQTGTLCQGLIFSDDGKLVLGVDVYQNGKTESVFGDFVIDATGRAAKGAKWLERFENPKTRRTINIPVKSYKSGVRYSSAFFRITEEGLKKNWNFYVAGAIPNVNPFSVSLLKVEHGLGILTVALSGLNDLKLPTDDKFLETQIEQSLVKFPANDIPAGTPELTSSNPSKWKLIQHHLGVTKRVTSYDIYRPTMSMYQYEKCIKDLPDNFAVIGDAYVHFNPIYGQGMTTALVGAVTLDAVLRRRSATQVGSFSLRGFAKEYFTLLGSRNQMPWLLSTMIDYQLKDVKPARGDVKLSLRIMFIGLLLMRMAKSAQKSAYGNLMVTKFINVSLRPYEMFNFKFIWHLLTA